MFRKIHIHITLLVTTLLTAGCHNARVDDSSLIILTTGNLHGAILPYDFKADTASSYSLSNISSYIRDMREIYGEDNILMLDAGGNFSGSVEAYYFNYIDTVGEPIYYRALKYIDYDAFGLSQNDLKIEECLHPRRLDSNWHPRVVCANLLNAKTKKPYFLPYCIVKKGDIRIAILGLTSPEVNLWLPKMLWKEIMTTDMVETAQEWVNYIRMVEKPDLLIGMFQCGRDYTAHGYEMDSYKNPNGGIPVIKMVDGFDLVIMGKDVNPSVYTVVNDYGHKVPVFNVGILGGNVATTVVHFNLQEDGSMKKIIHTAITPSSDYEVNEEFISQFSHDFTSIHGWITQKIGTFDNSCHPFEDFMFQSPYRKFINDAQLWYTEADVSISAIFTRTPEFKSGDVLMSDLLYYYSFENEIVKLRMTGQEIDRFLEFTYGNQYAQMTDGNCRLLNLWTEPTTGSLARDPEGHPYLRIPLTEFFEAAGIRYTVDVSKPRGNRVEIQSFADGSPFNLRSEYTVAMNSFHGSGGDDILYHAIGWNSETLQMRTLPIHPIHMREVMAQFLSHKGLYRFEPSTDWQLLPAKWIEAEKQRLKSDRATPIFSDNWK